MQAFITGPGGEGREQDCSWGNGRMLPEWPRLPRRPATLVHLQDCASMHGSSEKNRVTRSSHKQNPPDGSS